jgi:hypothetical protein
MKISKIEKLEIKHLQCDISTKTGNFYGGIDSDNLYLIHNSPAVIFGRNNKGEFVFTDKNGFTAKGYDGKSRSPDELREMFLNRSGGKNRENENYVQFVDRMADAFKTIQRAMPRDYRGYIKGDMLYFNTPRIFNNNYMFEPNIVEYAVSKNSELGNRIGRSKIGIVIHRNVDEEGNETPLTSYDILQGDDVLIVPPVSVEEPPLVNIKEMREIQNIINQYHGQIDNLLNNEILKQKQITDLPDIFYKYTNSKVDTGLNDLGLDFTEWLESSNLTNQKKKNVSEYINENLIGFSALWQIVNGIMRIKDNIIEQFDKRSQIVNQSIEGRAGGEGYVLADTGGDIKLVPREHFSKANRAKIR